MALSVTNLKLFPFQVYLTSPMKVFSLELGISAQESKNENDGATRLRKKFDKYTFLADVYGLLDQPGKTVWLTVNHCTLYYIV